jgi:hypothetical protein
MRVLWDVNPTRYRDYGGGMSRPAKFLPVSFAPAGTGFSVCREARGAGDRLRKAKV